MNEVDTFNTPIPTPSTILTRLVLTSISTYIASYINQDHAFLYEVLMPLMYSLFNISIIYILIV